MDKAREAAGTMTSKSMKVLQLAAFEERKKLAALKVFTSDMCDLFRLPSESFREKGVRDGKLITDSEFESVVSVFKERLNQKDKPKHADKTKKMSKGTRFTRKGDLDWLTVAEKLIAQLRAKDTKLVIDCLKILSAMIVPPKSKTQENIFGQLKQLSGTTKKTTILMI